MSAQVSIDEPHANLGIGRKELGAERGFPIDHLDVNRIEEAKSNARTKRNQECLICITADILAQIKNADPRREHKASFGENRAEARGEADAALPTS